MTNKYQALYFSVIPEYHITNQAKVDYMASDQRF